MGFFNSSSKKERTVVIFDIGSGSVGGAIAHIPIDSKGIPTIIKSARTEIAFKNELDFSIFLDDMLEALNTTATELYKAKLGAPEEIICVMASPWYLSETRIIKMSKEHSFIFTKRLADELFQKEIATLNETYKTKYGGVESAPEVIEHHIMNVSLNGYNIPDPIGKRSRSIEMNMIISLSPKVCLDKIRKTLSKTYHSTPTSFSSFAVASYIAVRDRFISPTSYLLLDISGEITDVGIVSKGILKATLSFPFGKKTFFKYMCSKLEVELRDAKELFSLYSSGTISKKLKDKLDPLFKSIENSWSEAFRACINTLPHTLTLPGTIFLTADTDIRDWFVDVIRNEEYIQSMVAERKCTVVTLEGPEFLTMCNYKDGLCDPFLMIEAIAVMRKKEK